MLFFQLAGFRYRDRRQSNPVEDDSIGHTAVLEDDHHSFALVHWTGYPSEHLFILTRRRTLASGYKYSDQSWLWKSVCMCVCVYVCVCVYMHSGA